MNEANYNKESCEMIRVANEDAVLAGGPGSFYIWSDADGQRYLACRLPDRCFIEIPIRPVVNGQSSHPSWDWDGNVEHPTLMPSVHTHGHWHGWFRKGRMESV